MKASILLIFALFVAGLAQEYGEPSIKRIGRFKILTGEGRLKAGILLVKLRQDQRFTNANSYFVSATMLDSTTADRPDSVRTFVVKNLSPTQFTIRSVKYGSDTARVRWMVIGE